MTNELLTFVTDPVFQSASLAVAGSGLFGVTGSIVALYKLKDHSPLATPLAFTTGVASCLVMLLAPVVGSTVNPGDADRWNDETSAWLASEHGLALEMQQEEEASAYLDGFRNGAILPAVDSDGERHVVQLVPYEGEDVSVGAEGETYQLIDVVTDEPFVQDEEETNE